MGLAMLVFFLTTMASCTWLDGSNDNQGMGSYYTGVTLIRAQTARSGYPNFCILYVY